MEKEVEKVKLIRSVLFPSLFLMLIWTLHFIQWYFNLSFSFLGLQPLTISGLKGIIFMPLLHGSWSHLLNNSIPFFVFASGLFYFYPRVAMQIMVILWLSSGAFLWLFARGEAVHIGASAVIYGLAFFHLTVSILKVELKIIAFSMLIIFLHGSMIWGFFPEFFPNENISWQGHLTGAISGVILGVFYKEEAPKPPRFFEDENDDDLADFEIDYWKIDKSVHP